MKTLVARFQYCRWGSVRRTIHDLALGDAATLPIAALNTAKTTIARLREAYGDREYSIRVGRLNLMVERTK